MSKLGLSERVMLGVNWMFDNPGRGMTLFTTTAMMGMFGLASYPTQDMEQAHLKRIAAARAYEAAKPKAGDTIEAVQNRMTAIGFTPVNDRGYKVNCLGFIGIGANPVFKGNEMAAQTIDPKPYFDCLDTYKPVVPYRTPTEKFQILTFVSAPIGGLFIGGVIGLGMGAGRRRSIAVKPTPAA